MQIVFLHYTSLKLNALFAPLRHQLLLTRRFSGAVFIAKIDALAGIRIDALHALAFLQAAQLQARIAAIALGFVRFAALFCRLRLGFLPFLLALAEFGVLLRG